MASSTAMRILTNRKVETEFNQLNVVNGIKQTYKIYRCVCRQRTFCCMYHLHVQNHLVGRQIYSIAQAKRNDFFSVSRCERQAHKNRKLFIAIFKYNKFTSRKCGCHLLGVSKQYKQNE